jgi:hypothetical protein
MIQNTHFVQCRQEQGARRAAARHPPLCPACEPSAATLYGRLPAQARMLALLFCKDPSEGHTAACYGAETAEGLQARGHEHAAPHRILSVKL